VLLVAMFTHAVGAVRRATVAWGDLRAAHRARRPGPA